MGSVRLVLHNQLQRVALQTAGIKQFSLHLWGWRVLRVRLQESLWPCSGIPLRFCALVLFSLWRFDTSLSDQFPLEIHTFKMVFKKKNLNPRHQWCQSDFMLKDYKQHCSGVLVETMWFCFTTQWLWQELCIVSAVHSVSVATHQQEALSTHVSITGFLWRNLGFTQFLGVMETQLLSTI